MKKRMLVGLVLVAISFAKDKPQAAQVVIKGPVERIRTVLLVDFVQQGFSVDSEVPGTQLQVSKSYNLAEQRKDPPTSLGAAWGSLTKASNDPMFHHDCRRVHRIIFLPNGELVQVVMQWEQTCVGNNSETYRHVENSKKQIKWMQDELEAVATRLKVDGTANSADKPK